MDEFDGRAIPPRTVVGTEALAALVEPARYAILNHILAAGPQTASQCAAVVGETASNCSWHLRALAKVGLVEPAPPTDGDARARPWQATSPGFVFEGDPGPAAAVARTALATMSADQADQLFRRYLARAELLPEQWTRAGGAWSYALALTPAELADLMATVDALIRPFVRPLRPDPPEGSAVVHVTLRAFLHPDVHRAGGTS